jgi:ABC-type Mn2+/Zn2+ transport system ATPase subunit
MAEAPIISVSQLTLGFGSRIIVHDLTFAIRPGEILGIVGPNGCGKTTLLKVILGLSRPLQGTVVLDRRLAISYVPQRDRIDTIVPITAIEVVVMGLAAQARPLWRPRTADLDAARRALDSLGVQHLGDHLFRTLSGGEQQRVLLARALVAEPDVLVLDEPSAGMDLASESAVIEFLVGLNRTKRVTVLIVTHLLSIVLNSATSVLLMGPDATLAGTVDEVLQEERLSRLYGVPVRLGEVGGRRTLVVESSRTVHA